MSTLLLATGRSARRSTCGDLTLAQFLALRRLPAGGADALYRLADCVERDARGRVPRRVTDVLATRMRRLGSADDQVLGSVHEGSPGSASDGPPRRRDLRAAARTLLDWPTRSRARTW